MAQVRKSGLRYGEVEAILAAVKNIGPDGLPAFRARLRHMRNIGVPEGLPQTGRGGVLRFSKDQVLEMLWCLDLQEMAWSPKDAANFASHLKIWWCLPGHREKRDGDLYVVTVGHPGTDPFTYVSKEDNSVIRVEGFKFKFCHNLDEAFKLIQEVARPAYLLLNLTFGEREMDKAILKVLA